MLEAFIAFIVTIAIIAVAVYVFVKYRAGALPKFGKGEAKPKSDVTSIKTVGLEGEGRSSIFSVSMRVSAAERKYWPARSLE